MLKKRIIPVLLLKNGRMVKGKNFQNFIDTGNPNTAVKIYTSQYADELMFIDITAKGNNQKYFVHIRTTGTILPWQYYQTDFNVNNEF